MDPDEAPALQVRLNLTGKPTIGALRVFVNLSEDMPNSAPLGLVHDEATGGVAALASEIV